MLRALAAAVLGLAVAAGLTFALGAVAPLPYAVALGAGIGSGTFLVVDGSAGSGDGTLYHRVRPRNARLVDWLICSAAGTAMGLALAGVALVVELGELGGSALVVVGAVVVANLVFLYRRPGYEEALEASE